ncbi:MAG: peptide ABC transporter substrate-binding protein, partial [Spirochaetes bacterium]|nr:peptide ABC transporter substrate-binding protein [Spirochaetota bacterium]
WEDGKPVTPHDFAFAWRYALEEHTPYSFLMTDFIKGAQDYTSYTKEDFLKEKKLNKDAADMTDAEKAQYKAKKDEIWANKVGVEINGNQLKVNLALPCPFFPGLTAFAVFLPMNEEFFNERKAAGDYGLEVSGLYANGPWKMVEWVHRDSFKLVKNENYWNKDEIKIDEIHLRFVKDVETRTNLLKTGQLDGSAIQAKDLKDFEDLAVLDQYNLQPLSSKPDFTVFYVEFNQFSNKYTQNANFRKAMAYSMDRQSFVEKINIGDTPAYALIPETFPGYKKSFREENGIRLFEDKDIAKAKQHLEKAKKELGVSEIPPIDMLTGESDIAKKIAEKFQADWAEVGIKVNLVPLPWGERMKRNKAGNFALLSSGWGPDYPDPMTYIDLFQTGNGNNHGRYSNPEFDKHVVAAKKETNAKKRMEHMYAAEKILFEDDMALVSQYYRTGHRTFKKYISGVVELGIGPSVSFYYADVDMKAKNKEKK